MLVRKDAANNQKKKRSSCQKQNLKLFFKMQLLIDVQLKILVHTDLFIKRPEATEYLKLGHIRSTALDEKD